MKLATTRLVLFGIIGLLVFGLLGGPQGPAPGVSAQEQPAGDAYYARYSGINGEADDAGHSNWIEVRSIDWGVHKADDKQAGESARKGGGVIEAMTLTIPYEKVVPKILEKGVHREVISLLEIELTRATDKDRVTYLRYELKNVQIVSYSVSGTAGSSSPPSVVVGNNFEEIKVTYTQYDEAGISLGSVETEFSVGQR